MALRLGQADDPAVRVLRRATALPLLLLALLLLLTGCGGQEAATGERPPTTDGAAPRDGFEPPLADGARVVLIGDSLATETPPTYADLLPAAAARLGVRDVETLNLSEPGTTTADWTPGSPLYEERLRPALAGADLVLVTAGGNDLQEVLGGGDGIGAASGGALASADAAFATVARSGRNLRRTFRGIRRDAPAAAIAYVSYPDYSASDEWQAAIGAGGAIALGVGLGALIDAAEEAGPDAVVDMLDETGGAPGGIDRLLADTEYLSPAGHHLYAERIAAALSG